MSHPAASIKSIFSGKLNLTDYGLADLSDTNETPYRDNGQSEGSEVNSEFARRFNNAGQKKSCQSDDDLCSELSYHDLPNQLRVPTPVISTSVASDNGDNYSVSSRNLKLMMMQKGEVYEAQNSSTNISLASSGSDYQAPLPNDAATYNSDVSQNGMFLAESFSRPLSRNSTTSCLSTTATKDGVEGKKLHRHGPTPYFSSVIANMLLQQQQQHNQLQQQNPSFNERQQALHKDLGLSPLLPPQREVRHDDVGLSEKQFQRPSGYVQLSGDDFLSVISQTNGEQAKKLLNEYDALGLPPVTLKEKMMLLNSDQTRP